MTEAPPARADTPVTVAELRAAAADRTRDIDWYQGLLSLAADALAAYETKASDSKNARPPDGYAYRRHSPFGRDATYIAFDGGGEVNGSPPIEAVPYWFEQSPGAVAQDAARYRWLKEHSKDFHDVAFAIHIEALPPEAWDQRIDEAIAAAPHADDCDCDACAQALYTATGHYPLCGVGEGMQRGPCDCRMRAALKAPKTIGVDLASGPDVQVFAELRGKPCTCPDTSATACGVERGDRLGELWYCRRAAEKHG